MSSPIDLTISDDEIISSRWRSKTKRGDFMDLVDDDDTPSKRVRHPFIDPKVEASPSQPRNEAFVSRKSTNRTSSRQSRHGSESSRTLSFSPEPSPHDGDPKTEEINEEFSEDAEFEEITQREFEQENYNRSAERPPTGHKRVDLALPMDGLVIETGSNIELQDGSFLRIRYMFRDTSKPQSEPGAYVLRGTILRRNRDMNGLFPKRLNELVAIVSMPTDDRRPALLAGLQDRPLADFACVREVRFTNAIYPECSFREDHDRNKWYDIDHNEGVLKVKEQAVFDKGPLVCRYKSVERWCPQANKNKPYSTALLTLEPVEADLDYRKSNFQLLMQWYRKSRGQAGETLSEHTAIKGDLMDLFCGGGGASEAAKLAGLTVVIAVDKKPCAVRTHQHNHQGCATLLSDVSDLITANKPGRIIVDACHSSCPCQYWSPLHTVPGKNDDANEAAAYMVGDAAKMSGCRIMCFEQTPGLASLKEHKAHWHMFIQQFTSMGFSVEWKIVRLADTGNPQNRLRLWIVATCPGQRMPEDVQPTHGRPGSGLRPHVTVRQAISNIPAFASMHNPQELEEKFRRTGKPVLAPAQWDMPLRELIATSGPKALHPDGKRAFTVREALCLQGFPVDYHLVGGDKPLSRTEAMTMVGDAVPPKAMAPFFARIKQALRITDEEIAAVRAAERLAIELDD